MFQQQFFQTEKTLTHVSVFGIDVFVQHCFHDAQKGGGLEGCEAVLLCKNHVVKMVIQQHVVFSVDVSQREVQVGGKGRAKLLRPNFTLFQVQLESGALIQGNAQPARNTSS